MTPIIPHKKEKPLTSLASLGGGAAGMANAGLAEKVYGDEIFSTYLYRGAGSGQVINNGIDNSGEGGMVWFKSRDKTYDHQIVDTIRGGSAGVQPNTTSGTVSTQYISSFNDNGFTLGNETASAGVGDEFAAWNFRKAKGFFDVVTYTGNGTARTIAHSLGCIPGAIWIKKLSSADSWACYHRGTGNTHNMWLNSSNAAITSGDLWNSTDPTATHFSVKTDAQVNNNGSTYVAYLFAGGESTASSATNVDFDGSGDYLSIPDSEDFNFDGDFCIELWIKSTDSNTNKNIIGQWAGGGNHSWSLYWSAPNQGHNGWGFKYSTNGNNQINLTDTLLNDNQWYHIAVVRNGTDLCLYRDGILRKKLVTGATFYNASVDCRIANDGYDSPVDCHISNVRIVKGSPVYTSSFKVSYKPLTNIANTVLLCCNGSTTTSSTVTPGTITANGDPTLRSDSPFDDPDGFKFGEERDQNMIKCGSHSNPATNPIRIYTGWEPQWLLFKNADTPGSWAMFDVMRGIFVDQDGPSFAAESNAVESGVVGNNQAIVPHADGFTLKYGLTALNPGNGNKITYVAIRRPDGYVSKPPELGTGVFAMDSGTNAGGIIPAHDSGFPVDFQLNTKPDSNWDKYAGARLIGGKYLATNTMSQEASSSGFQYDSNVGWGTGNQSGYFSWMWKRHASFDVVCYEGNGTAGHAISHNLSKTPEMMWIRRRNSNEDWEVYHKGLNGGTNPQNYGIKLNYNTAYHSSGADRWGAPTATHFTVNTDNGTNNSSGTYLAMLFASVDGISKVGYYTGTGGTRTITLGFQPRLLIYRKVSSTQDWFIIDTERGWGSGDDKYLELNNTNDEDAFPFGEPTSDGYTIADYGNSTGAEFIYYAHA